MRDGSHNAPSAGSKCVLSACNCLFNVCLSLSENDALVLQSSLGVAKWGGSLRTGSGWIIQSADHQTKCYANSQSRQAAVVGSRDPYFVASIPECFRRNSGILPAEFRNASGGSSRQLHSVRRGEMAFDCAGYYLKLS